MVLRPTPFDFFFRPGLMDPSGEDFRSLAMLETEPGVEGTLIVMVEMETRWLEDCLLSSSVIAINQ